MRKEAPLSCGSTTGAGVSSLKGGEGWFREASLSPFLKTIFGPRGLTATAPESQSFRDSERGRGRRGAPLPTTFRLGWGQGDGPLKDQEGTGVAPDA